MKENTDSHSTETGGANSGPNLFDAAENETSQLASQSQQLQTQAAITGVLDGKSDVQGIDEPSDAAPVLSNKSGLDYSKTVVTLRPRIQGKFRLGLENQPEKFVSLPGTLYRWAPKKVGNVYRTGLNRPEMGVTKEERSQRLAALELELGKKLDAAFYYELSVKLDRNKPLGEKLYLHKALDFVIFLAMLESEDVANGMHEYESGDKPDAQWYIENKEAEAERKAAIRDSKMAVLREYSGLSDQKKKKIAILAGIETTGLSALAVGNELWDWLEGRGSNEKDKTKPEKRIELFLLWVKQGDVFINVSALVKEAVKFNVIRKSSTGEYYYGDQLLGITESEVVQKLSSPHGSDLRIGITSKVESKQ